MIENKSLKIIDLCLQIDTIAHKSYKELAAIAEDDEVKKFWLEMSEEEKSHIDFWEKLENLTFELELPDIFENPDKTISELSVLIPKSQSLLDRCREIRDIPSAFLVAYRLEFYLLHPAFETFFHFIGPYSDFPNPEDTYENHINKFIFMLNKYGLVNPELELLGETLQRLWKENKNLAKKASTDSLTGILNRRGFFPIITQVAHLALRQKTNVGVMMLDIDHFKFINDNHGHQIGDLVLKTISGVIKQSVRASDIVCRYGGEEFCIFMPDIMEDAIIPIAERTRKAVHESHPHGLEITLSIGVVIGKITNVSDNLHTLIKKADDNLYKAKEEGRNRVISSF